jgi:hypothetical protein
VPVLGSVTVVGIALLVSAALVVVARYLPAERREPHNDVLGFVYAVVGVIYAVVLAMVVIGVWDTQDQARTNTYTETDALLQIYWYAHTLPQPVHGQIEDLAKSYTDSVVTTEWPLLARRGSSAVAWTEFTRLRELIVRQQPATLADQARYAQALDAAAQLGNARRERLNQAADGIPVLLWAALLVGALVTVGFAFSFGMRSLTAHLAVVCSITLLLGSLLLLVYELNNPFSGSAGVEPRAFELALMRMSAIT